MNTARSKAPRREPKPFLRRRSGLKNRVRIFLWTLRHRRERKAHAA